MIKFLWTVTCFRVFFDVSKDRSLFEKSENLHQTTERHTTVETVDLNLEQRQCEGHKFYGTVTIQRPPDRLLSRFPRARYRSLSSMLSQNSPVLSPVFSHLCW